MKKPLSDCTLEELWELFPIILSQHKTYWRDWYTEEQRKICLLLPIEHLRIFHIGSTAIPNIWAKPIIDILIELSKDTSMEDIKEIFVCNGYTCMSEEENRKSFNKGYTSTGFANKVFHLHVRYVGDHDELYFRDYMNDHPGIAKQYEALKQSLCKQFEHDRDAYTNAKSSFILYYTDRAKQEYKHRYE